MSDHGSVERASRRLVLFSGLGADGRVFVHQRVKFPQLIVPPWPVPLPHDSLDTYCQRWAHELRSSEPCVIGGASFGGVIALHIARYLDPLALLLIGSVRCPQELPWYVRNGESLARIVPFIPLSFLKLLLLPAVTPWAHRCAPHVAGIARQFVHADSRVVRWSICQLLRWKTAPSLTCPVFQIHGERDRVLPLRNTAPNRIVSQGGHVVSLTHPDEVNDFIYTVLSCL